MPYTMNHFLVCFLACVAVAMAQPPNRAEMEALKKQCQTEVGATDADASSIRPFQTPTTKAASCMMACLQKKGKMMNADNTFNSAAAMEMLSHMKDKNPDEYNKMTIVINTCKAQETTQTDQCEAAKSLAACMQTQRAAQGLPEFPSPHH